MKSTKSAPATTAQVAIDACRSLFGEHPKTVISPIAHAGEAMAWLAELFSVIAKKAEGMSDREASSIRMLAETGHYLAQDIGNFADHEHEHLRDRLRQAGVADLEGEADQ